MSEETKPPELGFSPGSDDAPIEEPGPLGVPEDEPAPSREPLAEAAEGLPPPAEPERPAAAQPHSRAAKAYRPTLAESREPLYHEAGGFRLRLEPADLARLRELPGSKGRTDRELGQEFFEKQAGRFAQSLAEDVTPPAEVRVVVDPYSRQAFLAIERTIRSILSF